MNEPQENPFYCPINPKISVVICTRNRFKNLEQTLRSLEDMQIPTDLAWELIVVDNNSTDITKEVIDRFRRKHTLPLRYVFEERQGKSHALNTAVSQVEGEIIAFTDDDCMVDSHWLVSITREFQSDPSLAGVGGRVELYNKEDKPVTIRTYRERIPFSSLDWLFSLIPGCNMAFTREVFDEVGKFDPDLGPGSRSGAITEDTDFLYRAYKKEFKMTYCPDVLVYHDHGRRTDAQVQALNKGYVLGRGVFYCKHILRGDLTVLRLAYWETLKLGKVCARNLLRGKSPGREGRLLRDLMVGAAYGLLAAVLHRPNAPVHHVTA